MKYASYTQKKMLYDSTYIVQFIEAESRTVVTRDWEMGRGRWKWGVTVRVLVWENEKSFGDGWCDGWMYLICHQIVHLKWLKWPIYFSTRQRMLRDALEITKNLRQFMYHQHLNGCVNCGICPQWNTIQQQKGTGYIQQVAASHRYHIEWKELHTKEYIQTL